MRPGLHYLFGVLLCVPSIGIATNFMIIQHKGITVRLHSNNPDGSVNVKIYGALELSQATLEAWNKFENDYNKIIRNIFFVNPDEIVHLTAGQN